MNPNDPRRPAGGLPYQPTLLLNQGWQQPAYGHPHGAGPGFGAAPGYAPHPGFTPQRPVKRGLGTGAIFAIVLGALVLLGGAVALAVAVLGSDEDGATAVGSAGMSDAGDHSAALQQKVESLTAAIRTRDSAQVEGPLLELAVLPDDARTWALETFGRDRAPLVFAGWERDAFEGLPALVGTLRSAEQKGRTQVRVERLATAPADASPYIKGLFTNMQVPRTLYRVRMTEPGTGTLSDDIEYFAVVDGQLGYVGPLTAAWGDLP